MKDAEISEKRAKLRDSLATGRPLEHAIANDEKLRKDFQYDEAMPDNKEQLDLDDECTLFHTLSILRYFMTDWRYICSIANAS